VEGNTKIGYHKTFYHKNSVTKKHFETKITQFFLKMVSNLGASTKANAHPHASVNAQGVANSHMNSRNKSSISHG